MTIPTNPNIVYKSPKNRDYRVAGIEKIPKTDKWINRTLKNKWMVSIVFLDNNEHSKLIFDHNYKIEKIKL